MRENMTLLKQFSSAIERIGFERVFMLLTIASFVVAFISLQGWAPTIVGSLAIGILAGLSFYPIFRSLQPQIREKEIKKVIPYDDWPNTCYACNTELGQNRGQFVVQKGDDRNKIKSVGLCEECTRTHSTLLDYSDRFEKLYDMSGDPEEI